MIAGSFNDISKEESYKFVNMKVTRNAETEFAMGHEPTEMSCPATTSHAGGKLLDMGSSSYSQRCIGYWCPYHYECEDCPRIGCSNPWCPCLHVNFNMCLDIYSNPLMLLFFIFSDKAHQSVPAPGHGALCYNFLSLFLFSHHCSITPFHFPFELSFISHA